MFRLFLSYPLTNMVREFRYIKWDPIMFTKYSVKLEQYKSVTILA